MAKKWDTPTDGISRKQFDRAMDSHIRRYVKLAEDVRALKALYARLSAVLASEVTEEE